jgi:hypothetical protein
VDCPPRHVSYPCQERAEAAVTLHTLAKPHCGGYHAWEHGDHWHVGHTNGTTGDACKKDPEHVAAKRRIGVLHARGLI